MSYQTISPKGLLFATDYPYNFTHDPQESVREYIENIRKLDLPQDNIDGMVGDLNSAFGC